MEADPSLAQVQYVTPAADRTSVFDEGDVHAEETAQREGGLKLWQNKYRFRRGMLPAFVGESFGKKVGFLCSLTFRRSYVVCRSSRQGRA